MGMLLEELKSCGWNYFLFFLIVFLEGEGYVTAGCEKYGSASPQMSLNSFW